MKFVCPVCGFNELPEPAYDETGTSSFEICPCCGTEFGYDDSSVKHSELRKKWISAGAKWWSKAQRTPLGWNAAQQLHNVKNDD
jgi:transcription elongation factor Elf1